MTKSKHTQLSGAGPHEIEQGKTYIPPKPFVEIGVDRISTNGYDLERVGDVYQLSFLGSGHGQGEQKIELTKEVFDSVKTMASKAHADLQAQLLHLSRI